MGKGGDAGKRRFLPLAHREGGGIIERGVDWGKGIVEGRVVDNGRRDGEKNARSAEQTEKRI